jgi:hypothetical protein
MAAVVGAYGTAEDPDAYGEKIAHRLFPNMLPYTVGTEASLGFVEWNGRTLTDNAPDVMFSTAGKHSNSSRDRQGVRHLETAQNVSLRSPCSLSSFLFHYGSVSGSVRRAAPT